MINTKDHFSRAEDIQRRSARVGLLGWVSALSIMTLAFFVGSYSLLSQSIRLDEAQSLWASTKPTISILKFISQDVAAPLYAVTLHFWIQLFGTGIITARLLSLLFFLLTLPFLYIMAKESSNQRVALVTVVLFSLSPFIIWYTSEARMYTLFTLVTSINHLYFLRVVRSNGKRAKTGYVISAVVGLYTHYFFIFLLITQGLYVVFRTILEIMSLHNKDSFLQRFLRNLSLPLLILRLMIIAGIFFLPWGLWVISQGAAANTQPLIPPPTSFNIFQTFVNFMFGFQSTIIQAVLISLWPLIIVVLFFVFTQQKKTKMINIEYFVMASFLPIMLVFLGSFIKPIFLSRYLILVTPTFFFTIAWLLVNNSRRVSLLLIGGVIIGMFGLLVYQNVSAATPVKEDYQGVSNFLEQNVSPHDIIAVSAPFTIYPIEYTYQGNSRIDTIPIWDRYQQGAIPAFSVSKLAMQMQQYSQTYNHVFIVLSYDQGYQKDIIHFMENHYKRDLLKDFSPGMEIREYQLRYF